MEELFMSISKKYINYEDYLEEKILYKTHEIQEQV